MNAQNLTKTDWGLFLVAWIASLIVIALVLEHAREMEPCALCLMQRVWFMIAGLIVLGGIVHHPGLGIYPLSTILAAAAGAGFSIRHIWLENLPPGEAPSCGPGIDYLIDAFPASEVLRAMTLGTGNCAESTWAMLGISIPIWALAGFVVIIAGALMQWRR